jgi:hypothetical protein
MTADGPRVIRHDSETGSCETWYRSRDFRELAG